MRRLAEARDHVAAVDYHHRSWLSPINSAPDDILFLVFSQLVQPKEDSLWHVAAVCQRWRRVALAQSGLWTQITHGHTPNDPLEMHRLELQLQRSQESMLHLDWKNLPKDRNRQAKYHLKHAEREGEAFNIIAKNAHRFSSVHALFDWHDNFTVEDADFSNLRVLSVHHTIEMKTVDTTYVFWPDYVFWANRPPPLFAKASNLTALALGRATLHNALSGLSPVNSLRHLTLDRIRASPEELLDLLSSNPHLVELNLLELIVFGSDDEESMPIPSANHTVTLSHLTLLRVRFELQDTDADSLTQIWTRRTCSYSRYMSCWGVTSSLQI